jgi:hypothetical protein
MLECPTSPFAEALEVAGDTETMRNCKKIDMTPYLQCSVKNELKHSTEL